LTKCKVQIIQCILVVYKSIWSGSNCARNLLVWNEADNNNGTANCLWWGKNNNTTTTVLRPLCRSVCVSQHLQLRTGGFCWCRVLLPACPCFLVFLYFWLLMGLLAICFQVVHLSMHMCMHASVLAIKF